MNDEFSTVIFVEMRADEARSKWLEFAKRPSRLTDARKERNVLDSREGAREKKPLALVSGLQRVKWDPSPGFVVNQARKTPGDISICRDLGRQREYRLSAEQTCKQTTPSIFPRLSPAAHRPPPSHFLLSFDFTARETPASFPARIFLRYPAWSTRETLCFFSRGRRRDATPLYACTRVVYFIYRTGGSDGSRIFGGNFSSAFRQIFVEKNKMCLTRTFDLLHFCREFTSLGVPTVARRASFDNK